MENYGKRLGILMLLSFLFSLSFLSFVSSENVSSFPQTNLSYFYSTTCSHCKVVTDSGILDKVAAWEGVSLEKYEISVSERNRRVFIDYIKKLGVPEDEAGTPFLVIEQNGQINYLAGDEPIINDLEDAIINFKPAEENGNGEGFFDNLTWGVVIISALIDSINPCAFGVLLFLMAVLLSMGSSKRALRSGLIYSFVIFVVYFLAGLGIMKLLGILSVMNYVKLVVGGVILIMALIEIKDFFFEGKGISLSIPASVKPTLEKYVHKGTLPAIIILGVLVALVELPCTGGIYLAILSLISESGTSSQGLTYLFVYNLIFVLPLILITYFIYRGTKVDSINAWVQKNKRFMRLAAGLIMIFLALSLFGVF